MSSAIGFNTSHSMTHLACMGHIYGCAHKVSFSFPPEHLEKIDKIKKTTQTALSLDTNSSLSNGYARNIVLNGPDYWLRYAGAFSIYYKKQELLFPCEFSITQNSPKVEIVESASGKTIEGRRDAYVKPPFGGGKYIDFHQFITTFVSNPFTIEEYLIFFSIGFDKISEKIKSTPKEERKIFPLNQIVEGVLEPFKTIGISPNELDKILAKAFLRRIHQQDVLSYEDIKADDNYTGSAREYIDMLLALMLLVEGSRNTFSYLSALMLLDLIVAGIESSDDGKPYTFRNFFSSDWNAPWKNSAAKVDDQWATQIEGAQGANRSSPLNVSGTYPMATVASGSGNLKEGNYELYPNKHELYPQRPFNPIFYCQRIFGQPQHYRVQQQEIKITHDWLKAADPTLYEEIRNRFAKVKTVQGCPLLPQDLSEKIKAIFKKRMEVAYSAPCFGDVRHSRYLRKNPVEHFVARHSYSIALRALQVQHPAHYYSNADSTPFDPHFHDSMREHACEYVSESYPNHNITRLQINNRREPGFINLVETNANPERKKDLKLSIKAIIRKISFGGERIDTDTGDRASSPAKFSQPKLPLHPFVESKKRELENIKVDPIVQEMIKRLALREPEYFFQKRPAAIRAWISKHKADSGFTDEQIEAMVTLIKRETCSSARENEKIDRIHIDEKDCENINDKLPIDKKIEPTKIAELRNLVMNALLIATSEGDMRKIGKSARTQYIDLLFSDRIFKIMEKRKNTTFNEQIVQYLNEAKMERQTSQFYEFNHLLIQRFFTNFHVFCHLIIYLSNLHVKEKFISCLEDPSAAQNLTCFSVNEEIRDHLIELFYLLISPEQQRLVGEYLGKDLPSDLENARQQFFSDPEIQQHLDDFLSIPQIKIQFIQHLYGPFGAMDFVIDSERTRCSTILTTTAIADMVNLMCQVIQKTDDADLIKAYNNIPEWPKAFFSLLYDRINKELTEELSKATEEERLALFRLISLSILKQCGPTLMATEEPDYLDDRKNLMESVLFDYKDHPDIQSEVSLIKARLLADCRKSIFQREEFKEFSPEQIERILQSKTDGAASAADPILNELIQRFDKANNFVLSDWKIDGADPSGVPRERKISHQHYRLDLEDAIKILVEEKYLNEVNFEVSHLTQAEIKGEDGIVSLDPCPECYRSSENPILKQASLRVNRELTQTSRGEKRRIDEVLNGGGATDEKAMADEDEEKSEKSYESNGETAAKKRKEEEEVKENSLEAGDPSFDWLIPHN